MLVSHSTKATSQVAPTEETMAKEKYFLHYALSHPDTILSYIASNMVLSAHNNASYLTKTRVRIRSVGNFFMLDNVANPENNGAVLKIAQIIKNEITLTADV